MKRELTKAGICTSVGSKKDRSPEGIAWPCAAEGLRYVPPKLPTSTSSLVVHAVCAAVSDIVIRLTHQRLVSTHGKRIWGQVHEDGTSGEIYTSPCGGCGLAKHHGKYAKSTGKNFPLFEGLDYCQSLTRSFPRVESRVVTGTASQNAATGG
jgi:hypothetical protein